MKMKRFFWLLILTGLLAPCARAVWDVTTPAGSESKSLGDDRIRELKSDIQTTLQYEGDFPGSDTSNPRFIWTPSHGTTAGRPTLTNAATGMLYVNDSSGTIDQFDGSSWHAISSTRPFSGQITPGYLDSSVAGNGLLGGAGLPLSVAADTTTFTITNDSITIRSDSIGTAQLADAVSFPTSVNSSTYTWKNYGILPILQIQSFSTSVSSQSTAITFVNSNLTVSITPSLSTSKILVWISGTARQGNGADGYVSIARNGSNLGDSSGGFVGMVSNNNYYISVPYLDSPGTTSTVTYTAILKSGSGGIATQFPAATGSATHTASIYVFEIAQ